MIFWRKLLISILLVFFLLPCGFSQNITCNSDSTLEGAINCFTNYVNKKQLFLNADSTYSQYLNFILNYYSDTSIQNNIIRTRAFIQNNNPLTNIRQMNNFADSLISRRKAFNKKREQLTRKDSLIARIDSTGIESDSAFIELLEVVFNDQANQLQNDSLQTNIDDSAMSMASDTTAETIDTLNTNHFYPDSLIHSLKTILEYATNDSNLNWINKLKNDTTYLFIINAEGDSLQLKLHKDNKDIIQFDITDFWGIPYPGVIRDMNSNSFRLLINDAPTVENTSDDKAKDAVNDLLTIKHLGYDIVLKRRPVPPKINHWLFYGNSNFDASQIVLHQWSKGGESSISFLAGTELYLKYKKNKHTVDNYAKFELGLIRQGDYTNDSTAFFKTNKDKIEIQTKYGYKVFKNFSMSGKGKFESQFAPSYEYPTDTTRTLISQFMNPAVVTFALGMNYKDKSKKTEVFFSPITGKTTMVLNDSIDETKYGIDAGKKFRHEWGSTFTITDKRKIWGDIAMENSLELFSNYMEDPQNIDLDWEIKFILPVNDFIRATVSAHLIYDDNETVTKRHPDGSTYDSKGLQIEEMIRVGFFVKY